MNIEVTLFYTTIISIFLLVLSIRVIDLRGSPVTKFMHTAERKIEEQTLERAIRGHGNLIEYAPLFLILMFILELSGASTQLLYLSGLIFTLGRFMHGIVYAFMEPNLFMRIGGMSLTFVGMISLILIAMQIFFKII